MAKINLNSEWEMLGEYETNEKVTYSRKAMRQANKK